MRTSQRMKMLISKILLITFLFSKATTETNIIGLLPDQHGYSAVIIEAESAKTISTIPFTGSIPSVVFRTSYHSLTNQFIAAGYNPAQISIINLNQATSTLIALPDPKTWYLHSFTVDPNSHNLYVLTTDLWEKAKLYRIDMVSKELHVIKDINTDHNVLKWTYVMPMALNTKENHIYTATYHASGGFLYYLVTIDVEHGDIVDMKLLNMSDGHGTYDAVGPWWWNENEPQNLYMAGGFYFYRVNIKDTTTLDKILYYCFEDGASKYSANIDFSWEKKKVFWIETNCKNRGTWMYIGDIVKHDFDLSKTYVNTTRGMSLYDKK